MSEKNDRTSSRTKCGAEEKRNHVLFYVIFFFLLIALAVTVVWVGGHYFKKAVLYENPRLVLRQVKVRSTGYWSGKEKQLTEALHLRCSADGLPKEADGLFTLDPAELRQKVLQFPGIKDCEVRRILPDTLDFRLIERMPRAILDGPRSNRVVDDEGILFPRDQSVDQVQKLTLPVIIGYKPEEALVYGKRCPGLENTLEIILLVVRNFPDLELRVVDLSRVSGAKKIVLHVRYRKMRQCQAIFPAGDRNYSFRLSELQSAILYAEQRGDRRNVFDLSFEGSAIIR